MPTTLPVKDRPSDDRCYAIGSARISEDWGLQLRYIFTEGFETKVDSFLVHFGCCKTIRYRAGLSLEQLYDAD